MGYSLLIMPLSVWEWVFGDSSIGCLKACCHGALTFLGLKDPRSNLASYKGQSSSKAESLKMLYWCTHGLPEFNYWGQGESSLRLKVNLAEGPWGRRTWGTFLSPPRVMLLRKWVHLLSISWTVELFLGGQGLIHDWGSDRSRVNKRCCKCSPMTKG